MDIRLSRDAFIYIYIVSVKYRLSLSYTDRVTVSVTESKIRVHSLSVRLHTEPDARLINQAAGYAAEQRSRIRAEHIYRYSLVARI